jgi:hypothetical protein
MRFSLGFDPSEDRMKLLIQTADQSGHAFWLRRNQCLSFIVRMQKSLDMTALDDDSHGQILDPKNRLPISPVLTKRIPEVLKSIKVVDDGSVTNLTFVGASTNLILSIPNKRIVTLINSLIAHCERVGWDPEHGIRSHKALIKARALIAKSKAGGEPP